MTTTLRLNDQFMTLRIHCYSQSLHVRLARSFKLAESTVNEYENRCGTCNYSLWDSPLRLTDGEPIRSQLLLCWAPRAVPMGPVCLVRAFWMLFFSLSVSSPTTDSSCCSSPATRDWTLWCSIRCSCGTHMAEEGVASHHSLHCVTMELKLRESVRTYRLASWGVPLCT